jgi:hypothetical protein
MFQAAAIGLNEQTFSAQDFRALPDHIGRQNEGREYRPINRFQQAFGRTPCVVVPQCCLRFAEVLRSRANATCRDYLAGAIRARSGALLAV